MAEPILDEFGVLNRTYGAFERYTVWDGWLAGTAPSTVAQAQLHHNIPFAVANELQPPPL